MHTLVLLLTPIANPDEDDVRRIMDPHRCDEGGRGRFDYYTVGGLYDGHVLGLEPDPDKPASLYNNRCQVEALQCIGAAIVTPDGEWHDSSDDGHVMLASAKEQSRAWERWLTRARRILEEYSGHTAVAVDAHS